MKIDLPHPFRYFMQYLKLSLRKNVSLVMFLCALYAGNFSTQAQNNVASMIITKNNDTSVVYLMENLPSIIFDNQYFKIKYNDLSDNYRFDEVAAISYSSDTEQSGMSGIIADGQSITVTQSGTSLSISSSLNHMALICKPSGEIIMKKSVRPGITEKIDLGQLQKGLYILNIGKHTYKFMI